METIENNQLLAVFDGLIQQNDPNERWFNQWFDPITGYRHEVVPNYLSWEKSMPLVEKVNSLNYTVNISASMVYINGDKGRIVNPINVWENCNLKEAVYKALLEFVNWYNREKSFGRL